MADLQKLVNLLINWL